MDLNIQYEKLIDDLETDRVAVIPFLFDNNILEGLYHNLLIKQQSDLLHTAGIGNQLNRQEVTTIRNDKILWIDNDSDDLFESLFIDKIRELSTYLNRTCFTGIAEAEFMYACYEKGSFYKRHIDRFKNDNARKFSLITYLTKEWEEKDGGELVIYKPDNEIRIRPQWGLSVLFRSHELEHEVLTSNQDRYSITGWLK